MERQTVLGAIEDADGDLTRAARTFGIGRAMLYRKLLAYGRPAGLEPGRRGGRATDA